MRYRGGAREDGFLGCLHPSRPMGKAALITEELGTGHPSGRHPKISPMVPECLGPAMSFQRCLLPSGRSQAGGQACARTPGPTRSYVAS